MPGRVTIAASARILTHIDCSEKGLRETRDFALWVTPTSHAALVTHVSDHDVASIAVAWLSPVPPAGC